MIRVSDLALSRGERVLFRGLSLAVGAGEAVALTGANGAGKTSLLRAVAGFIRADGGEVEVTAPLHLLGHLDGFKGGRPARAELEFQAKYLGADDAGIASAVERLRLKPLLDLEVRKLSAGQRRRLAFAWLLAAPRPLWLLDEPLSPLDARWRAELGRVMSEHLAGGGAILAAVHDPLPIPARLLELGA